MFRPTYCEIDLSALKHNYYALRAKALGRPLIAVVKANAYGHGVIPIVKLLQEEGVKTFAVASLEEAIELRQAGIIAPILCLSASLGAGVSDFLEYRVVPVAPSLAVLKEWSSQASFLKKEFKVHLEIDTGMGRLGVLPDEIPQAIQMLKQNQLLSLEGVLTHFACADELDSPKNQEQRDSFLRLKKLFLSSGLSPIFHLPNSAGILANYVSESDWVRPGLALYGAYPDSDFKDLINLKPVLSWKTKISLIKQLPANTSISYGATYTTQKPSYIAVLPVGYADGYSRLLSNRGEVLIGGQRCPILGRVCMDLIMVDVTNLPHTTVGEEVVLIGAQGSERITAEELAERIGTISYEVFCNISSRVPRVYQ